MAFYKSNWFKYLKNFIIGVGAAVVMLGALGKINSEPWGGAAITIGLSVEAFIFCLLGILPPEKDYYWEKLYPGLERYHSRIAPLTEGDVDGIGRPLDVDVVENSLGGMLSELQSMSKSLGSLKALQEVDFTKTGDQIKAMGNFYERMGEAMENLNATVEDTKVYANNIQALNGNLNSMNAQYDDVVQALASLGSLSETAEDAVQYKEQLSSLNRNLRSLNSVYGNVLSAFGNNG